MNPGSDVQEIPGAFRTCLVGAAYHRRNAASERACREAMIEVQRCYPHRSAICREAAVTVSNMDDLALLITGKRDYFVAPRHSNPAI